MSSSLEWAVSAAASVGVRFIDDGYRTELYEADGPIGLVEQREPIGGMSHNTSTDLLISRLTDLQPRRTISLRYAMEAATADNTGRLVVAIMGRMSSDDAQALLRVRRQHARGLALLLDVDSFTHPGRADGAATDPTDGARDQRPSHRSELAATAALLSADGWQVVQVDAQMSVADAWSALAGARTTRAGTRLPQAPSLASPTDAPDPSDAVPGGVT
jgi:hypothetical protein